MDYGAGTVRIIPASALREQPYWFDHYAQQEPQISYPQPVNAAYYMGGMYNAGYAHEPYGQNAFIVDPSYGDPQWPYYNYSSAYPYQQSAYPGAYGPYPGASGAYRPYPQPQPSPPRRSRTAPSRAAQRSTTTATVHPSDRRSRGFSAEPYDRRQFKGYFGPSKKPLPMYKKRREPTLTRVNNVAETDFGGGGSPLDTTSQFNRPFYPDAPPTLRRHHPFYAPSYTTYPASTMHRTDNKMNTTRYPIWARGVVKFGQVLLGAAILGLVLGPMKDYSFYDFVIRTNTEWQGLVVGIVSAWAILSGILLVTCFFANRVSAWRTLDGHITLVGIIAYLIVAFLEAYYAACYPPNGPKLNLVCHRAEWIIADILAFFNVVLYIIDFVMSYAAGLSLL